MTNVSEDLASLAKDLMTTGSAYPGNSAPSEIPEALDYSKKENLNRGRLIRLALGLGIVSVNVAFNKHGLEVGGKFGDEYIADPAGVATLLGFSGAMVSGFYPGPLSRLVDRRVVSRNRANNIN